MSILIKQAKILQAGSKHHKTKKDILISNGRIEKIANKISQGNAKLIESDNLHVSLGWLDIGTMGGEPGYEHRETFDTLSNAAAAGGYTGIALFPNTKPSIDNKSSLQFVINNSKNQLVSYYPVGAISKNCEGQNITEMIDMHHHGAVAFSDGIYSISSNGLLLRALQYVKSFDGLIIHQPDDPGLSHGNSIHEGISSTKLGLKGSPALAEVLTLERDILMANYAESRLLIHKVSCKESIEKLSDHHSDKIQSSVAFMNLIKTDESLLRFDVNYKCSPPLRSQEDKAALVDAVNNGLINIICSNHVPVEEELKKKEFVYADTGAIGLQTCFSAVRTFGSGIKLDRLVFALSQGPRQVLGLSEAGLEKGDTANITVFDPDGKWDYNIQSNKSKSKNSPFIGETMKGKVLGIINGSKSYFNA